MPLAASINANRCKHSHPRNRPRLSTTSSSIQEDRDNNNDISRNSTPPFDNALDISKQEFILDNLTDLFQLTRPSNFPSILLLHFIGSYLALSSITDHGVSFFWMLQLQPLMIGTVLALFLTSATSMVVNDYYDAKLGRDHGNRPLVTGKVSFATAKLFLTYLYGTALIGVAVLPGVATRLSVLLGLILTYYYTQYLKPITWVKNIVCASLIALSPLTSGSATIHMITQDQWSFQVLRSVSLLRLVGMLFFGLLGREIMMDCNDVENDRGSNVHTVPVQYGLKFATTTAFVSTLVASVLAIVGPVFEVMRCPSSLYGTRRLVLSVIGGSLQVWNAFRVFVTGGRDKKVTDTSIEQGFISVLFLLLSFV